MADEKLKGPLALSREDMMEAVALGVCRAIRSIVDDATPVPGHDFYAAIEDGVRRGMGQVAEGKR